MDWNSWTVQLIAALTPLVTTVLVWLLKGLIPKIPRVALPVIAMLLPVVASWFYSFVSGGEFTPVVAALLGSAAVFLREVVNTFTEHKLGA